MTKSLPRHILEKAARDRGFAVIVVAIIITLVFAFSVILLDASLSTRHLQRAYQGELAASQIAEAGVNKAIFCLNATSGTNCGGTYGSNYVGESNVSFGGGTFTTALTGGSTTKTVTATGTAATGETLKVVVDLTPLPPTDSIGFSYALQSGAGGAHLENNSSVSGTLYSNGNIDCQSTNAVITGDAYSSLSGGSISGCKVSYQAHADSIINSKVGTDAYYLTDPTGIAGTTVTGTKHPNSATPTSAPLPPMDLDFWRESATAGGVISGSYSPANNSKIGPVEIDGDLTLGNNVNVTVEGPVWVKGNITTGNNSTFTLDSSFGSYSTVILADYPGQESTKGYITLTNNTGISGSGDPESHILFASTNSSQSDTVPALSVANNAAGAVFYAMNGVMRLQNGAGAKSLAGYRLFIDQTATVTYVMSDFTGQFSNSPGGTWHMSAGTWHEVH